MTAADRPTVPHPDLDTLADLDAGVLDPAAAEDVAAHVGGCARCTAAMAALDAVRADLRDLPRPAMPASVAARLDATVADLRRGTDGAPAPPARPPQSTPRPFAAPPAPGGPGRPAAAGPPGPPAAEPGGVADLARAREAKERRRRSIKLSTGAAAAAFVLVAAGASVAALVDSAGDKGTVAGAPANADNLPPGDSPAPRTPAGTPPTELAGIPSYTKESLRGAIDTISSTSAVQVIEQLGETGPGGQMANAARRQACERSIPSHRGLLTAVRRIDYEGKPAYVFVFTDLTNGERAASVVTMDCGTTGALSATVLDEVR